LEEYNEIDILMTLQFFLNHISENSKQRKRIIDLIDQLSDKAPHLDLSDIPQLEIHL
jgi:hypothetical protein